MKIDNKNEILTDEEIKKAFVGHHFGDRDHRKVLEQGCLQILAGYSTGHYLTCIMRATGLISKDSKRVLKKGVLFIYESFKNKG